MPTGLKARSAVHVMRIAPGEIKETIPDDGKDPAAKALGKKSGATRAKSMPPERRAERSGLSRLICELMPQHLRVTWLPEFSRSSQRGRYRRECAVNIHGLSPQHADPDSVSLANESLALASGHVYLG
jgi:hypothetical protein